MLTQRSLRRVGSLGVVSLMAAGLFVAGTLSSNAEDVTCFGKAATVVGTDGEEFLSGTPGDDVMAGLGGNDTLQGMDGNDAVCGGADQDDLYGEAGTDQLDGGEGTDTCNYNNGSGQAEGSEVYEGCEKAKESRASDPSEDPEAAENPIIGLLPKG